MTLGDFLTHMGENPFYIIFYFTALPIAAFLANVFGKGEGDLNPWCTFYSVLIYMVAIPGIFSIILNVYHILFENHSIYDLNLFAQILPIVSMFLTFYLIKKNISFDQIPGFGKLANLLGIITGAMFLLFILEKTHLIAFTYVPFVWVIILLIAMFVLIRLGAKKMLK